MSHPGRPGGSFQGGATSPPPPPRSEAPAIRTISRSSSVDGAIRVPSSKSLTQRALVCAALAPGESVIRDPLDAEDTLLMAGALAALGAKVDRAPDRWSVCGMDALFGTPSATLLLGNAGTAMRFLTPVVSVGRGTFTLDGSPRMRERPIGDLISALHGLGVKIRSRLDNGCPPVEIEADGLAGGRVAIRGAVSSQFLSGLLLAAPRARGDLILEVEGPLVSRPYVGLTLDVMRRFGAEIDVSPPWRGRPAHPGPTSAFTSPAQGPGGGSAGTITDRAGFRPAGPSHSGAFRDDTAPAGPAAGPLRFHVRSAGYRPADYPVEGDASSACWWFAAAAITGGRIRVHGIPPGSGQGDLGFLGLLREMGCRVTFGSPPSIPPGGATGSGGGPDTGSAPVGDPGAADRPGTRSALPSDAWIEVEGSPLRGIEADLRDMPDAAPALGAVALFASSPTRLTGAAHLRAKESDRIAGLAAGLGALGARVREHRDGLTIVPGPLGPATLDSLGDHRLAMAFAVAGLGIGHVSILDPGCVAKSYPRFFEELERIARPRGSVQG